MDGNNVVRCHRQTLLHCGVFIVDDGDVEGCELRFGQNSHLQNLLTSFLGKQFDGWYVEHKFYLHIKGFVVQLVEHSW
jgi:hypothetical protein